MTPLVAVYGIGVLGVLGNIVIGSAYQGDVLIDQPWAYFTCGEQYPAGSGTANDGAQACRWPTSPGSTHGPPCA